MGDLTRNFSRWEFESPDDGSFLYVPELIDGLQELRDAVGCPIHVNRGTSSKAHNAKVGGVPDSQHLYGRAADIHCAWVVSPSRLVELAKGIAAFEEGGIGLYRTYVHLDVRGIAGKPRARWIITGDAL